MGNAASSSDGGELPVLDLPGELSAEGADAGFGTSAATTTAIPHISSAQAAGLAALNLPTPPAAAVEIAAPKAFTVTTNLDGNAQELLVTVSEYTFGKTLGQGGFGKVVLATSARTGHAMFDI